MCYWNQRDASLDFWCVCMCVYVLSGKLVICQPYEAQQAISRWTEMH